MNVFPCSFYCSSLAFFFMMFDIYMYFGLYKLEKSTGISPFASITDQHSVSVSNDHTVKKNRFENGKHITSCMETERQYKTIKDSNQNLKLCHLHGQFGLQTGGPFSPMKPG